MKTEYFSVNPHKPDESVLAYCGKLLRAGKLVAFPTETVYGLGASGYSVEALKEVYKAKGRPSDNPLILHISDERMLGNLVAAVPETAKILIKECWPGPLTMIFPRSQKVPNEVTGGLETVAIRFPSSLVAQKLIRAAGVPIAAPSANKSGRPSPIDAQAVKEDLDGKIDAIIDGGVCDIGLESTVLDCTEQVPVILRPGGITVEMLTKLIGPVALDPAMVKANEVPRAPGMKYRHYAPKAPVFVVTGSGDFSAALAELAQSYVQQGRKVGLLVCREWLSQLPQEVQKLDFGSFSDPAQAALNLYPALRHFDDLDVDVILAQGLPDEGLGRAVMNRLLKAAAHQVIQL